MTEQQATESEQIVRDFVAWQNGDEAKKEVMAESIDVYNPGLPDGEAHRREEVADYIHKSQAAFPDVEFTIKELIASGNIVMAKLTVTGTHKGEFKGIPPTGRAVEFGAMAKYIVVDEKIEEIYVYYDTQELVDQLGLTVPTVLGQLPKLAWRKLQTTL